MYALRTRLILAASLVLAVFLGVTGFALDRIFQEAALEQVHDRLQSRIYALLAAAEIKDNALALPRALPDPDYAVPGSGLYVRIDRDNGQPVWRSRSMLGLDIPFPKVPEPGQGVFSQIRGGPGPGLFTFGYRVRWELSPAGIRDYLVQVAESRASYAARLANFRHNLWFWLAGVSLMLLAVQGLILAWSLTPLRHLVRELAEIEHGDREFLSDRQPLELQPLVRRLNQLIRIGRRQLERHRNALADLAHSLKTPLSVLKNSAGQTASLAELQHQVQDTVSRMDDSLSYQLRRAAAGGNKVLVAPTALYPLAQRLRESLLKVHADKHLRIAIEMDAALTLQADSGDLLEILGNLLDNACKWASQQVLLRAHRDGVRGLILEVDDDGPGIPAGARERILERGTRIDEHTPGHGLGLAIVRELVTEHYAGDLQVGTSPAGGARVTVLLREED